MDRRNAIVSQNTKFGIYNVRIISYTILSSFRNAPVYRGNDPQIQQHTAVNFLDKLEGQDTGKIKCRECQKWHLMQ
jgi:hypothetical protein